MYLTGRQSSSQKKLSVNDGCQLVKYSIAVLCTSFKTNRDFATTLLPRYDGAKHHHTSSAAEPAKKL